MIDSKNNAPSINVISENNPRHLIAFAVDRAGRDAAVKLNCAAADLLDGMLTAYLATAYACGADPADVQKILRQNAATLPELFAGYALMEKAAANTPDNPS
jgi:hypothetical protein